MPDDVVDLDDAVTAAFDLDGAVITGWVLVATYDDGADNRGLMVQPSDEMTPWLQKGMLYHALHMDDDADE